VNATTTTHLARVLSAHVLPTLGGHGIEPIRLEIHSPGPPDLALVRDCQDAHGHRDDTPTVLPSALLEVQLQAIDWARLFCPVQPGARQEAQRPVDICDPAAAEYCLDHPSGIGERWTVARVDCSAGQAHRSTFRAMDGAFPGVVWMCCANDCATYAELEARLIAWETGEDRHHLPG
jgi:hypothetical protein